MSLRQRHTLCFGVAVLATFVLWLYSRALFHFVVPWGLKLPPYLLALFAIGVACRLLFRGSPKLIYGGIVAGGCLGTLWPAFDIGDLCIPCNIVPLLLFPMAGALGAWVASHLR